MSGPIIVCAIRRANFYHSSACLSQDKGSHEASLRGCRAVLYRHGRRCDNGVWCGRETCRHPPSSPHCGRDDRRHGPLLWNAAQVRSGYQVELCGDKACAEICAAARPSLYSLLRRTSLARLIMRGRRRPDRAERHLDSHHPLQRCCPRHRWDARSTRI